MRCLHGRHLVFVISIRWVWNAVTCSQLARIFASRLPAARIQISRPHLPCSVDCYWVPDPGTHLSRMGVREQQCGLAGWDNRQGLDAGRQADGKVY